MVKILIVEDERPISDLIKMNLSDAGYLCTTAYDGLAAADLLEEQSFDLVLLDIMLPKVDGYELFEYKTHENSGHFSNRQGLLRGPGERTKSWFRGLHC